MAKGFFKRLSFILALLTVGLAALGNVGQVRPFNPELGIHTALILDTIPQAQKPVESVPQNTKPEIIKEVPKSRRQMKPVAVPKVPVKPIKIIKPKIIRRTLMIQII